MLLTRFWNNCRGNVAPLLGIAIIPLMGAVGAAVDYTQANATRTAFQVALDSTALMLSKNAALESPSDLQTSATSYFNALFVRPNVENVQVTADYSSTAGSQIVLNGTATIKTNFLGVLGIDQINISAHTTSVWGNTRLRVALVLDNTGSMSSSDKMTALKTASQNLLQQLQAAATTPDDVYVSIIPFVKDVNVDPSNYNQSWVDLSTWSAPPASSTPSASVGPGSSCPWSKKSDGFTCTTGPANGSSTTSTVPNNGTYKGNICPSVDSNSGSYYNGCYSSTTYSCTGSSCTCNGHTSCSCSGSGGGLTCKTTSGKYEHAWIANATSTWNGCVTDRDQNFDTTNDAPVAGGTLYPAEQYSNCPVALTGLTNDWTALSSKITAMQPNGNTNQAIGLQLGWQSLTNTPFTIPAEDPNYQYNQVIILLTDGLNTQDRWYTSASSIDARQQKTCDNIKAAGITVYTVQVNTGGDPTSTLLQNCASDSSKFYLLTSSNAIITTFGQIGTALTNLRLAM
ncbi:MAG: VWA domain-containing protein [Pseudolabrys sp.]